MGVILYDVSELVKEVRAGVVTVTQRRLTLDMFLRPVESEGTGTGIVIDDSGHVITNFHVIAGAEEVTVVAADSRPRPARVIGGFAGNDLAVLEVADHEGLQPLPLGSSSAMEVGDPVIAIGNALGLDSSSPSVSVGIVSAKDRTITAGGTELTDLLQTDAAINPGNSGGPLLNGSGAVIGINTAIAGGAQNIGFAIAIDTVRPLIDSVLSGVGQPYVGVSMYDNTPALAERFGLATDQGVLIVQVLPTGPAASAGLEVGDIVVAVGGTPVASSADLQAAVEGAQVGDTLRFEVIRGRQRLLVDVTVGQR